MSNSAFPYMTSRVINIGMADVKADRVTYMGTLGYDIFIPTEMAVYVYQKLKDVGQQFNIMDGGYYAIDTLRTEKGYRAWAHELKTNITPIETGCAFTIDWTKDFIGKSSLLKQKENGVKTKIVSFTLDQSENLIFLGDEPVFKNGELVGNVTSVKYGHFINKWVGLCKLTCGEKVKKITNKWLESGNYEISVLHQKFEAKIHLKSPYDPNNIDLEVGNIVKEPSKSSNQESEEGVKSSENTKKVKVDLKSLDDQTEILHKL